MRTSCVGALVDPLDGSKLTVETFSESDGHVITGVLRGARSWYPIIEGVPCFLGGSLRPDLSEFSKTHGLPYKPAGTAASEAAEQTRATFSDKWRRFPNYGFEESHQGFLRSWYVKKLGFSNRNELDEFYSKKRNILEVGPGSGFNSRYMAGLSPGSVYCADLSDAAMTSFENTKSLSNCHAIQADLFCLPFSAGSFDFVIADGVLHHTPDTRAAVEAVWNMVAPEGHLFFYVYKRMGAIRRFADEYLREQFSQLAPDECYRACEGLTELGRELSKLSARVTLERGIPALGMPAGTHDVQRLIYYSLMKCFWNDAFDFETNNMVNFDWYRPQYAWQHTEAEVREWLRDLSISNYSINDANPNGISVLARRTRS